jgi:aconitate hydratase
MIIEPSKTPEKVEIKRGPNIGEPPYSKPLADKITGECSLKVGDKITTDHIMPAGSRLKYRSNIAKYSTFVFEGVDPDFHIRAAANRDDNIDNIIVGGLSYGQGSSREHAAVCPMFLGVKAVIAKSFERIHSANLINFGIIPFTFKDESDYDKISEGDKLILENMRECVKSGESPVLKNISNGNAVELTLNLSERQKEIILAGGMLNVLKK